MSEYLNRCIKCDSLRLERLREIDPETTDMNMTVVARCLDCNAEAEYRVGSHYYRRQRDRGMIM